jgi:hypothetical protein
MMRIATYRILLLADVVHLVLESWLVVVFVVLNGVAFIVATACLRLGIESKSCHHCPDMVGVAH